MKDLCFKLLERSHISEIVLLGQQLNPSLSLEQLKSYQEKMFDCTTYQCFGLFFEGKLKGIAGGWISVRFYSGKQLEVDNVIIDSSMQSKGFGKKFFQFMEEWAKQNDCQTIELNTYVQNSRSHKFYYNLGFSILGFHFLKKIST